MTRLWFILLAALALPGCAGTGIVPMDGDTYMIGKRSAQLGFGPPVAAKAHVYAEANKFCKVRSRTVETVRLDMTNSGFGRPASASLQFRCIQADEPKAS